MNPGHQGNGSLWGITECGLKTKSINLFFNDKFGYD